MRRTSEPRSTAQPSTATSSTAARPIAVTIAEASALSGLSRSSLYNLIAEGRLSPRKYGARTLILFDELDAFLRGLPLAKDAPR
ncbi:MAG: helix-turn-helix domain-containing protein [Rhodospirillales bacterium]|jgi:excisionase family DNA binding protein